MRILLTGATGFLGRHVSHRLLEQGYELVGLGAEAVADLGFPCLGVDLRNRKAVEEAVEKVQPDGVVHLAALSHVGDSWQRVPDYFAVNVLGTEALVAASRKARMVFASSAEVYGVVPPENQPIPESWPVAPGNPYALTKAAAERWVLAAGGIVVRLFNVVGTGQAAGFAIPSFARQLAAIVRSGEEGTLRVGNLSAQRDFVHVRDAAEAFLRVLELGAAGEVYNLASGEARSLRDVLDRLIALAGVKVSVLEDPARMRPQDLSLTCGDSSRLRALGWSPRYTLEDALREVLAEALRG
jgi:GDP-4-dehydro-6-deoxy-D-mannose reductase